MEAVLSMKLTDLAILAQAFFISILVVVHVKSDVVHNRTIHRVMYNNVMDTLTEDSLVAGFVGVDGMGQPKVKLEKISGLFRIQTDMYGKDIKYCSNRKEIKDHGDKGILLGSPIDPTDKVIIIEDVTTAGTSIKETMPIIKEQGDVNVLGLVVSVDRMERGQGTKSALAEIQENYGMKATAIVTMEEVVEHLYNKPYKGKVVIDDEIKKAIDAYYEQYGAEN